VDGVECCCGARSVQDKLGADDCTDAYTTISGPHRLGFLFWQQVVLDAVAVVILL